MAYLVDILVVADGQDMPAAARVLLAIYLSFQRNGAAWRAIGYGARRSSVAVFWRHGEPNPDLIALARSEVLGVMEKLQASGSDEIVSELGFTWVSQPYNLRHLPGAGRLKREAVSGDVAVDFEVRLRLIESRRLDHSQAGSNPVYDRFCDPATGGLRPFASGGVSQPRAADLVGLLAVADYEHERQDEKQGGHGISPYLETLIAGDRRAAAPWQARFRPGAAPAPLFGAGLVLTGFERAFAEMTADSNASALSAARTPATVRALLENAIRRRLHFNHVFHNESRYSRLSRPIVATAAIPDGFHSVSGALNYDRYSEKLCEDFLAFDDPVEAMYIPYQCADALLSLIAEPLTEFQLVPSLALPEYRAA